MRRLWVCVGVLWVVVGAACAEGGTSGFTQQLEPAALLPFTAAAASGFPVAEMWFFVEGVTESGTAFAYLNTVARYTPFSPYSALRPVYGASMDDICAIGKPLGIPFSGDLTQNHTESSVYYSAPEASFGMESPLSADRGISSFVVSINDTSAGVSSHTTAFGPMFTFQYVNVNFGISARERYVQVMGATKGTLHGERFSGWGGIEYHRGYQGWGASPPFADYWYTHWLLRANVTDVTSPTYSMAIVGSEESGFFGGYDGTGSSAVLLDHPVVEEILSEDCDNGEMPTSVTVSGLAPFVVNTRISVSTNFWWVARIVTGLFGWWELHAAQ